MLALALDLGNEAPQTTANNIAASLSFKSKICSVHNFLFSISPVYAPIFRSREKKNLSLKSMHSAIPVDGVRSQQNLGSRNRPKGAGS